MSQVTTPQPTCFVVGILLASAFNGHSQGVRHSELVRCEKYGFSMTIPRGWLGGLMNGETPMFMNFRETPKKQPDSLPKGGATIGVVAADDMPGAESSPKWLRALHDFAVWDARRDSQGDPALARIQFPSEAEVHSAVTTAYDVATYSPDEQPQHCVRIYWEFKTKFFVAHLTYVKGDPKGSMHEKVFLETIRSIRPLRK
jgi:hypothetical protein